MKNILLAFALIGIFSIARAQDAADKSVQAGLIVGFGMNFQKMGTKLLENNGIGSDITIGANVNFSLTETIGFCTGVEFDFESLKYKAPAGDTVMYFYRDDDNSIVKYGDAFDENNMLMDSSYSQYFLNSRKQKATYITIPTMLSFSTKYIGYFRYFGKFGLRTSILLSNKINDEGSNVNLSDLSVIDSEPNNDMSAKSEMFPIKSAVGLAGGAEWNFTGATVLAMEIGYYYGFTPLYNDRKEEKTYLQSGSSAITSTKFSNKANQSQLMFKISILF